jgi:four helix bundle protein
VKDFRDLVVWSKSHDLTLAVYKLTEHFPKEEMFGLKSQIRRSSASIPANIAEGCGRGSNGDFGRFLYNAMGSACELEYHLLLSKDLGYLAASDHKNVDAQVVEVKRMLSALIAKVNSER